ncbi:MAG: hypothetical protein IJX54_04960 [Oscillospiraceae bacterium]|nr:hypothetical protein [Oscillospiraceae bacterium]
MKQNRIIAIFVTLALAFSLCGCRNNTVPPEPDTTITEPDVTTVSTSESETAPTTTEEPIPEGDIKIDSEFVGSYLTMRMDDREAPQYEGSYFMVFSTYDEIAEYYETSCDFFFYGRKFTIQCASYSEGDFMANNDVLILKVDEPSSYITHSATSLRISDGKAVFGIERHMPKDAPLGDTQYHLIYTAPKGTFDALKGLEFEAVFAEINDLDSANAFDSERYLYIYPEFWPFVYKADAISAPGTIVDSIESYNELVEFYERYKTSYDFEDDFKKHIGSLYDERMFDDYILLMVLAPCDANGKPLEVGQLFVYNLEVFIAVNNSSKAVVSDTTPSYLLVTAVSKKDLKGVNLSMFNISFN